MSGRKTQLVFLALTTGIVVRLSLTLGTFGSDDVMFSSTWAELAHRYGIVGAYAHARALNFPPLGLALMLMARRVAEATPIPFGDVYRLMQVVAEAMSFACLLVIGRRTGMGEWSRLGTSWLRRRCSSAVFTATRMRR